ncbi:MAG: cobaltochelatase subunit CobN [Snowella sp.]|nr:cobaltochelatase subunit CobN [Snowella sp.]
MHRLTATPGGWTPETDGVIFIEQNPGEIVILTAADTDIQCLAATIPHLPSDFPTIRSVHLLNLQQPLSIDDYADKVLSQSKVIILRLLGGRSYWLYGLEILKEIAKNQEIALLVLPGDDRPDPELMSHSTVPLKIVHQVWQYFTEGGIENWINGLKYLSNYCLKTEHLFLPPQVVPKVGIYAFRNKQKQPENSLNSPSLPDISYSLNNPIKQDLKGKSEQDSSQVKVGILFYRSHYLAGNTLPIDALCQALIERNLIPVPIFISSLRDIEVQEELINYFQVNHNSSIQVLLNTTSFSLAKIQAEGETDDNLALWKQLNLPILQVIFSSGTVEQWENSFQGLSPRDVAMNVALPEVDGRIITRAISFKAIATWNEYLETHVVSYQPQRDRVNFVADLTANLCTLKNTPIQDKKIAIILANYPNKDGRLANGVGLDTPASCIKILEALKAAGYYLENEPKSPEELIERLTQGVTNDLESRELRQVNQSLSLNEYHRYFESLPLTVQAAINERWQDYFKDKIFTEQLTELPIAGIQCGNIFIGIQPSRGYDIDPGLNYHAPDLEPTPEYLAFYYWLREKFKTLAIIHLGKHGNLEWLPGKSLALSNQCYPEIALNSIPNFYPFIVNDPGEGSQAKRRSHAVILDHLTPPLTRAELYGDLQKLENLIDEYYEAQSLDPTRLKPISDRLTELITKTDLHQDLGIDINQKESIIQFLNIADGYLCELKEAQIRDGLHIFGECPQGQQLRDLILAIARSPGLNRLGLTQALAQDLDLDFNPLTTPFNDPFIYPDIHVTELAEPLQKARIVGDAIAVLEDYSHQLIETLLNKNYTNFYFPPYQGGLGGINLLETQKILQWIQTSLLPSLQQTTQEITNLLKGLNGEYVPSGASGAPTRGRPEVLPTGRNFYSVDIRAIPTETAWDVGRKAAEALVERYTQDHGDYPKTLAISIWGTSTMRTGGDDLAQVLALLGVRPIWDGPSRRVVDFEILPVSALGRPRVDVTVRISGFFRDSFPNLLQLLNSAIQAVSDLDEEPELNPLAAKVQQETQFWQTQGLSVEQAEKRASYRIFGSKPGAYGAGLQGLIESQNWQTDQDLAKAYINWSCYAYDQNGIGHGVPEVFEERLKQLDIVLHNQDNREHDLLDSDDYYQFQGGLSVAVRALTGKNPTLYFGDNAIPENPKVKLLTEEIKKVYRSRVINPKWIEGVMRHGYKGAFEMAATVDYLFAYDATTHCVEDFIYQGVAEAYVLDEKVQAFIQSKNPWALRDMAERLLEASQRGLWRSPNSQILDQLREIVHQAEGSIESNHLNGGGET